MIVSSLVLALGLGIVAITMKEVKLSGAGRDSQLAFYAADSGLECAEYGDLTQGAFATSSDSADSVSIKCNNVSITSTTTKSGNSATSTFKMYMEYNNSAGVSTKPCAIVSVNKYLDGDLKQKTSIDARGYNTCDESNVRRLERGYSVKY